MGVENVCLRRQFGDKIVARAGRQRSNTLPHRNWNSPHSLGNLSHVPTSPKRPKIPWKRFWTRYDEPIHVGSDQRGFLSDPEDEFIRYLQPNVSTLDNLLSERCLVLWGDPGIGKSTVLGDAKGDIENSLGNDGRMIWIEFRDIPSDGVFARRTFDSPEWQEWKRGTGILVLVIDGVDEGLIKIPGFLSFLTGQLRIEGVERLRLILACRSSAWSFSEGEQLIGLWGQFEKLPIFELCPLRETDAALAAEKWGLDRKAFIEAVYKKSVAGLAALPTTLFFLLAEFQAGAGFSGSHRELYESGCRRLCEEIDPIRLGLLRHLRNSKPISTPEAIHEAATRIAAFILLCAKSAVHFGPSSEAREGDLHINEIVGDSLSTNVILDCIASGLFSSRGADRLGFAHQTFAECLAAQYLCRLPLIQIRKLICARDAEEHVVPQLAETAAWVAGKQANFFDYLCRIDPEALLRSDVSKAQDHRKAALVAVIMNKFRDGEWEPGTNFSRFLDSLKHPGIDDQLRPFINDKGLHVTARRMAMNIAAACGAADLCDDLFRIVRDASERQKIRDDAASTLEELIPESRVGELIPLAEGRVGADVDDNIRACAIRRLVPSLWSVSQALPAIRKPRNRDYHGDFDALREHHLPAHFKDSDLPHVLCRLVLWINCFDRINPLNGLAEKAFAMALRSLAVPNVKRLAVRIWIIKHRRHHPLPSSQESVVVRLLEQENELRREFMTAILNDPATSPDGFNGVCCHPLPLFRHDDFEWALNQIVTSPQDRRPAWASVIRGFGNQETIIRNLDLLLQRIEEIPELKEQFPWLRAWNIDEPIARQAKADWLEAERDRTRDEKSDRIAETDAAIDSILEQIASGKTFAWIKLCELMSIKNGRLDNSSYDVTQSPGWLRATEARKGLVRDAARKFLLDHSDGYAEKASRTNYSDPGFLAVWLLRDEVPNDALLAQAIAAKWIDAIVGRFCNGEDDYQELAALAYKLNPDKTLQSFVREIKDDNKHGHINVIFGFQRAWDGRFTATVLDMIQKDELIPDNIRAVLKFITPFSPTEAVGCAESLVKDSAISNPALHERNVAVLTFCLSQQPAQTWAFAWPILDQNKDLAKAILLRVADRVGSDKSEMLSALSEKQLADLYLKLCKIFPPTSAQPSGAFRGVSAIDAVPVFSGNVASTLAARGTEDACRELLRLADELPDQRHWLRWKHHGARTSMRRIAWSPPDPKTVAALAQRGEARLVFDADDLLEVIMESLERLQTQLTQSTLPSSETLWHWEGADTQRTGFRPRDEASFSDAIARWLRDDLKNRGIVIGREVQLRRGQRTDIYIEAVPEAGSKLPTVTVVIEIKGCWNKDVTTAVASQLVGDYIQPNGHTHGIYIVGWFVCDQWEKPINKLASRTFEDAKKEVEQLVADYDGKKNPERVNGLILDCRYPTSTSTSRPKTKVASAKPRGKRS